MENSDQTKYSLIKIIFIVLELEAWMKAVLKSSIEFPQDALIVGENHIHDRLKQNENFGFHFTTRKHRDTASCSILSKMKCNTSSEADICSASQEILFHHITERIITEFTASRQFVLSWTRHIHSVLSQNIYLRHTLILYFHHI